MNQLAAQTMKNLEDPDLLLAFTPRKLAVGIERTTRITLITRSCMQDTFARATNSAYAAVCQARRATIGGHPVYKTRSKVYQMKPKFP